MAEATEHVEDILKKAAVAGDPSAEEGSVDYRPTCEYCFRGNEAESLLIACRKDTCSGIKLVFFEAHEDKAYREKGKEKIARMRTMVADIHFKQNIGHMGCVFAVAAVHLHYRTAKLWPSVADEFWDTFADRIKKFRIKIFSGDFNMSLTQVIERLRSRGIVCDCIAWYPFRLTNCSLKEPAFGLDSCGIFYVGGTVSVRLDPAIDKLLHTLDPTTAVADDMGVDLDTYVCFKNPGQHWSAYRPSKKTFKEHVQCLAQRSTP